MTVIKVLGLSGCSKESWSDAVLHAVVEATRLLQPITNSDSDKSIATNVLTRLDEYRATVCVAFIIDEHAVTGLPMQSIDMLEYSNRVE